MTTIRQVGSNNIARGILRDVKRVGDIANEMAQVVNISDHAIREQYISVEQRVSELVDTRQDTGEIYGLYVMYGICSYLDWRGYEEIPPDRTPHEKGYTREDLRYIVVGVGRQLAQSTSATINDNARSFSDASAGHAYRIGLAIGYVLTIAVEHGVAAAQRELKADRDRGG